MNCSDLETLLCDYVDGTLGSGDKAAVEQHLAECPACAGMARDSAAAVAFMEGAAVVEPPPELLTRVLFDLAANREKTMGEQRGLLTVLGHWFGPALQPRFAMGMAMTVLSFSMLARFAGINVRQISVSDLDPVKVWQSVENRAYRGWTQTVKSYESLRLVYEIRSRLEELTAPEDTAEQGAPASATSGSGAQKKQGGGKQQ